VHTLKAHLFGEKTAVYQIGQELPIFLPTEKSTSTFALGGLKLFFSSSTYKIECGSSDPGIPRVFPGRQWPNLADRGTQALSSRQSHQVTTNVRWGLSFDAVVFVT
jgi:hypothetical protein